MMARLLRAASSFAALAALAVLGPAALMWAAQRRFGTANPLGGIRAPWTWTTGDVDAAARRPLEDDTAVDLIVRLCIVAAWCALAIVLVTTAFEVVHLVRHRGLPSARRRGTAWAQPAARFIAIGLVQLLAASSVTASEPLTPLTSNTWSTNATASVAAAPHDDGEQRSDEPVVSAPSARTWDPATGSTEAGHILRRGEHVHVVQRGDSVWSIAERFTGGDDVATMDVAERMLDRNLGSRMNDGTTFSNPALIRAGWELVVPVGTSSNATGVERHSDGQPIDGSTERGVDPTPRDETGSTAGTERTGDQGRALDEASTSVHVVRPGESLTVIAERHLGDPAAWPEIAEQNLGRTMADGRRFDDPDLILPGWELRLPNADTPVRPDTGGADAEPGVEPGWDIESDNDSDDADTESDDGDVSERDEPDTEPDDGDVSEHDEPHTESNDGDVTERDLDADASTTPVTDDWFDTAPTRTAATDDTAAAARPPSPAVTSATTTTTTTPPLAPPDPGQTPTERPDATPSEAPAPLGIEHAGMLAGGLLMLAAVRRRRRLRAAIPRARIPEPPPSVVETERVLRSIGGAERAARLDVAIRALAHRLVGTGVQPGAVLYADDGTIEVVLTGDAAVGAPWSGDGRRWELAPSMPLELLAEDARHVGSPCPALVSIGRIQAPDGARSDMASDIDAGGDLFLDLEAAGVLVVDAPPVDADSVVTSLAATIASSSAAETAHIVTSGLPERAVFDHPNATGAASAGEAIERALGLLGSTLTADRGTFDLRVRRTGGEAWEPAIVLLGTTRSEGDDPPWSAMPEPGRGLAAVVACPHADVRGGARLTAATPAWRFDAFGWQVDVHPAGLDSAELARLTELLDAADQAPIPDESAERVDADLPVRGSDGEAGPVTTAARGPDGPGDDAAVGGRPEDSAAAAFAASDDADEAAHRGRPGDPEPEHAIVVRLLGGVSITDADGATRAWQRSKTVELIAWLATHRHRSTRSAARTAMWADEVRDATFSNVVSEARRGLARLVEPPSGEEWIPRTLTEELPLHHAVVTDLDLIEARLTAARLAAPAEAIGLLRPTMSSVRGLPFADTAYLWPDADGLVTNATLLATTACAELAGHALSLGDIDTVFEATRHGLSVLPGHEELIALRMRAHARAGDLSGVRSEWESYERVLNADAWSDGEPAPKLLDLRRELLSG